MNNSPNIIIFNPDQWRGDVLGHMGDPAAVTPNLDRLAKNDFISFRNAFVQNPVCTPSRCSFMSGWYPHTRGHRTMYHMLRQNEGDPTLLKKLKDNGYFVWWGGKNDLVPSQNGFKEVCDIKFSPSKDDFKRWGYTYKDKTPDWQGSPDSNTYYSFFAGKLDKGEDDIYCDNDWAMVLGAIDLIKNHTQDQPLCIYLPLSYPHPPYCVEEPFYSMIDRSKIPPRIHAPVNWKDKPCLLEAIQKRQNLQTRTEDQWTELKAVYYGMCARVDYQFGLIIKALKDSGIYDNSAIFFFSDHGDFTGDYGLVEKTQNTFEDCLTRVPFLIKPPANIPVKPRISETMVELVDLCATIYDITNINPGYDHSGKTLLPVISGLSEEHRDAVFCEGGRLYKEQQAMELESASSKNPESPYWPRVGLQCNNSKPYHGKATMCRTKTHKYIHRLYEKDELYDLQKDPYEQNNIIDIPAYSEVLQKLKNHMLYWYQETCDVVPYETDKR